MFFLDKKFKKFVDLQGYAVIDENKHCIIIVYGEGRRDDLIKELSSNEKSFIKYHYINLNVPIV